MYKGLKVEVYTVDKTEIILTRQDLIELVNVRIEYCVVFCISRLYFDVSESVKHAK